MALNNIQYVCPEFSAYIINTYREPAILYVANSDETILSEEGTTQGDNSAMGYYSCSLMPLIKDLKIDDTCTENIKQIWYADDAAAGGKLEQIKKWWIELQSKGPGYGYLPRADKTWLVVKEEYFEKAKEMFPHINVTTNGHKYLGSFIGPDSGKELFMSSVMTDWKKDVAALAAIAESEPQLAYAAFVYGTSKRWNFVARTTPNISHLFKPLEHIIKEAFIPKIIGKRGGP